MTDQNIAALLVEIERLRTRVQTLEHAARKRLPPSAGRQAYALLQDIQEAARVGYWTAGLRQAEMVTWSAQMSRIFGVAEGAFDGRMATMLSLIHPDDLAAVSEAIEAARNEGRRYLTDHRIIRRDGGLRWVHAEVAVRRNRSGGPAELVGVVQDVTERKRAEHATSLLARMWRDPLEPDDVARRIVSAVRELFVARRANLYRADASSGDLVCVATAGEAPGDDWIGARLPAGQGVSGRAFAEGRLISVSDVLDDRQTVLSPWVRGRIRADAYRAVTSAPLSARGRRIGVLSIGYVSGGALAPEQRELLTLLADQATLALDSAEMYAEGARSRHEARELAETAQRLTEQLAQARKMEAVGRAASDVAHDFNNLLTVITGRMHLVLNRNASPQRADRRDLEIALAAAQRGTQLTRQLLAFGRTSALQPRPVDLAAIVEGIMPMLRGMLGEDIELVVRRATEVSLVQADPSQIEQVLLNLAVNARDAMSRSGRLTLETMGVSVGAADSAALGMTVGDYVVLKVADTGLGMDAETRARVFEPFFTTKETGTGLGLSIVHGIVHQHAGAIRILSELGRGTTVEVYLPRG